MIVVEVKIVDDNTKQVTFHLIDNHSGMFDWEVRNWFEELGEATNAHLKEQS